MFKLRSTRLIFIALALIVTMGVMLAAPGLAAHSATPTLIPSPTPFTLSTLRPTATDIYLYLRPTPTLIPFGTLSPALNLNVDNGQLADQAINIYRYFNHDHIFDYLGVVVLALVCVVYVVRIIGRTSRIK